MPKLDGLKEELGYFKLTLSIVIAIFTALVGWIATNYNKADYNFCNCGCICHCSDIA
ncbi:hypothetical protein [Campylobacter helveticus]|uniref:hypothetical protein n=1 Tax=Campylobacter helveticus TaxID=28898 RepID=UPI00214A1593|nr:hypothetical protein [Campylobacter helveticus]MCR2064597.1 hypothetical protein [Campylobacter helveticus]